jgi:hypothetical protein
MAHKSGVLELRTTEYPPFCIAVIQQIPAAFKRTIPSGSAIEHIFGVRDENVIGRLEVEDA